MEFVDLSEHFLRISRFLYLDATIEAEQHQDNRDHHAAEEFWEGVAEPLHIAGSIESISVTPSALNPDSGMMCSTAWEYDLAASEVTAAYLKEITRFMWSWIALEKLADLLCGSKGGRTERIIQFLKRSPSGVWEEAKSLGAVSLDLFDPTSRSRIETVLTKTLDAEFAHIHICREARNDLFHAHSINLFPSDEFEILDDPRVRLPKALCRITLLVIQSVLHAHFYHSTYLTGELMTSDGVPQGVPLPIAARYIHFSEADIQCNQSELFAGNQ